MLEGKVKIWKETGLNKPKWRYSRVLINLFLFSSNPATQIIGIMKLLFYDKPLLLYEKLLDKLCKMFLWVICE